MFCPKCGKADQSPETYCRQCGIFLYDIEKARKIETPPEKHLMINTVLNSMSIIVSMALAFILYSMNLNLPETRFIVYLAVGFLIAMSAWQIQTLWRTVQLKKQIKTHRRQPMDITPDSGITTDKLLEKPDFENMVPASVTDRTTKHLAETKIKSSQTEH